jgi:hypothetical protein
MQTYVDLPMALEEAQPQVQKPLWHAAPTFNGQMLGEELGLYANGSAGLDGLSDESEVESETANDLGLDAEDDDEIDEALENKTPTATGDSSRAVAEHDGDAVRAVATAPVALAVAPVPAAPVVAGPVITAKNGQIVSVDEVNAAFARATGEPDDLAPPPTRKGEASATQPATPAHTAALVVKSPAPATPKPITSAAASADEPATPKSALVVEHRRPEAKQPSDGHPSAGRQLHITFRRSGDLERDKFRLKSIYDLVRNPRGSDRFFIRLEFNGQAHQLAFPNEYCTISDRLLQELQKHFRVDVAVMEET